MRAYDQSLTEQDQKPLCLLKKKAAIECGKRIKLARHLANLTRQDMLLHYGINPHTLHAWEKGANGLTEENAQKLFEVFQQRGLLISKAWLLYGEDPRIALSDIEAVNQSHSSVTGVMADILNVRADFKILEEIEYFQSHNAKAISTMIADEALMPLFAMGDYVGGIQCFDAVAFKTLVGSFCIISSQAGEVLVRKIVQHQKGLVFRIAGINPLAALNSPDYFDCAIQAAAPISRHWHVGQRNKLF